MALEKVSPLVEIKVLSRAAGNRVASQAYAVSDVFAGFLARGGGEASDATSKADSDDEESAGETSKPEQPGFDSKQWRGQYGFEDISGNLDFITFHGDGTAKWGPSGVGAGANGGAGGFVLKAREEIYNCAVGDTADKDLPKNRPVMRFQAVRGDWGTRVPDTVPLRSGIYLQTQAPDRATEAAGETKLAACQGFALRIVWFGIANGHSQPAGFRVIFPGGRYSCVWRNSDSRSEMRPQLERRTDEKWEIWKRLDVSSPGTFSKPVLFRAQIIAGRLVISIDGESWHVTEEEARTAANSKTPAPKNVYWPEGELRFTVFGALPHIEVAKLTYLGTNKKPQRGFFIRKIEDIPQILDENNIKVRDKGWQSAGATTKVTPWVEEHSLYYKVELFASPDGTETPLVSGVMMHSSPVFVDTNETPLDLRPYLQGWEYSSAEPGVLGSSTFSCELDRTRLDREHPDWPDRIQQFSPLQVKIGWRYRDTETGSYSNGPLREIFDGYILNPDRDLRGYNARSLSLQCGDKMVLLQEPAGFIDDRYAPLDLLYTETGGRALYGGQCVKHLLGLTLGPDVAASINGDGDPLRFFASTHQPLMSRNGQTGYFPFVRPFSEQGFVLPPPFGESVSQWISTIAGYDYAVFYWGKSPFAPNGPDVPIYGRAREIARVRQDVEGSAPVRLPDAIYVDGDAGRLLGSARTQYRAEKAYNTFIAWGSKPKEASLAQIAPALDYARGMARLGSDDPNSADHSWRRTLLLQQEYLDRAPGSAQQLANRVAAEFEDTEIATFTFTLPRGDETLHWGRTVQAAIATDEFLHPPDPPLPGHPPIPYSDPVYYVMRVSHRGDMGGEMPQFSTELVCRPLSGTGN